MFNLVRGVTYQFITVIPNLASLAPNAVNPIPFSVIEGEVLQHFDHLPLAIIRTTSTNQVIQINLKNVVAVL